MVISISVNSFSLALEVMEVKGHRSEAPVILLHVYLKMHNVTDACYCQEMSCVCRNLHFIIL